MEQWAIRNINVPILRLSIFEMESNQLASNPIAKKFTHRNTFP